MTVKQNIEKEIKESNKIDPALFFSILRFSIVENNKKEIKELKKAD